MDTKLTLKLNDRIISRAKRYAKLQQTSLSKLIENYLDLLTENEQQAHDISPLVRELTGVIRLDNENFRKEYTNYLEEKYR